MLATIEAHVQANIERADCEAFQRDSTDRTPGQVALLYFGPDWQVVLDSPVRISEQHSSGSASLTYNSILLTDGDLWAATCLRTHEMMVAGGQPFDWDSFTGRQRSNQMATALATRLIYGTSVGDLLTRLATVAESAQYGTDRTNWTQIARILVEKGTQANPSDIEAALCLVSLTSPRFAARLRNPAPARP